MPDDLYVGARFAHPEHGVWRIVYVWPATKTRREVYTIAREKDPCIPARTTLVGARFLADLTRISGAVEDEGETEDSDRQVERETVCPQAQGDHS